VRTGSLLNFFLPLFSRSESLPLHNDSAFNRGDSRGKFREYFTMKSKIECTSGANLPQLRDDNEISFTSFAFVCVARLEQDGREEELFVKTRPRALWFVLLDPVEDSSAPQVLVSPSINLKFDVASSWKQKRLVWRRESFFRLHHFGSPQARRRSCRSINQKLIYQQP
jgi:hypothetical protein